MGEIARVNDSMARGYDFSHMSNDDLRVALAEKLKLSADSLADLAAIWVELERRGEDLSGLRSSLTRWLPAIASNALLPDLVVQFAGRPWVLDELSLLPIGEQRRLADGGKVMLAIPDSEPIAVPVSALTSTQARVVFGGGRVRHPNEQVAVMSARHRRKAGDKDDTPVRKFAPRVDRTAGVVMVGRMSIPLADLLVALASDAGPDKPPPMTDDDQHEYRTASAKLWAEEKAALSAHAKRLDLPERELVRKALRAYGLLTTPK